MAETVLERIADLLAERNAIDHQIAMIIGRPMTSGHLGEWIAARVFDIELEASASATAIDGRFRSGPLTGRSVNVKWYLKREGILDMVDSTTLDYYLVLTGPTAGAASSRATSRPWRIDHVYLFDARLLTEDLRRRGRRIGTASSVRTELWRAAEIFPSAINPILPMSSTQIELLRPLGPASHA